MSAAVNSGKIKILFSTQAEGLRLFDALHHALRARGEVEGAGFIVADSSFYLRWLKERPDFELQNSPIVKEWEITAARHGRPDLARLALYERQLGAEAGLFGAIVADRRLFMGKDCTYSQDYRRRFTDNELLCILQSALEQMEKVFDTFQPDVLVSFICVTMLDYVAYLFANARGINVLNLRPTRVGDRVTAGSTLNDPSPEFAARYAELMAGSVSAHLEESRAHIDRVRQQHGRYEGVVRPSDKPALRLNAKRRSIFFRIGAVADNYLSYRSTVASRDNHVPDPLRMLAFAGLVNPWRAKRTRWTLQSEHVNTDDLRGMRYAFYPLHTEPEVSLLVYGRPFVNQIEVIRWLAMSLPADMVLVVKEHPWMVGKRTAGAYNKVLNIPRVKLADPKLEARSLVLGSDLVVVVTGSVALEAAVLGKPVITLGDCPYNLLPRSMLRRCEDLRRLPALIREMIDDYTPEDLALQRYIAAVMDTSVRLNLYSVLLEKKGVHVEQKGEYGQEIDKLADYLSPRLRRDMAQSVAAAGAAAW